MSKATGMTDDPKENIRREIAEIKSMPDAKFHADYGGDELEAELMADIAALQAEAAAMLAEMDGQNGST